MGEFLKQWKETHGNQDYPHKATVAMKPYDVLIERRPDLPHIALTCENTHTALPYIDIVNEILEYYVANGKLDEGGRARHRRRHHGGTAGRAAERDPRSLRQAA